MLLYAYSGCLFSVVVMVVIMPLLTKVPRLSLLQTQENKGSR